VLRFTITRRPCARHRHELSRYKDAFGGFNADIGVAAGEGAGIS
jgi:hypothetical protein